MLCVSVFIFIDTVPTGPYPDDHVLSLHVAAASFESETAYVVAVKTNGQFVTAAVARRGRRLIYLLAGAGNVREAEQLASSYRGPGWRGFAYSVIVATTDRKRIGFDSGGPSLDLQEISVEH